jgi:hypothetical protein
MEDIELAKPLSGRDLHRPVLDGNARNGVQSQFIENSALNYAILRRRCAFKQA